MARQRDHKAEYQRRLARAKAANPNVTAREAVGGRVKNPVLPAKAAAPILGTKSPGAAARLGLAKTRTATYYSASGKLGNLGKLGSVVGSLGAKRRVSIEVQVNTPKGTDKFVMWGRGGIAAGDLRQLMVQMGGLLAVVEDAAGSNLANIGGGSGDLPAGWQTLAVVTLVVV